MTEVLFVLQVLLWQRRYTRQILTVKQTFIRDINMFEADVNKIKNVLLTY